MNAQYQFLIMMGLYMTVAYLVGMEVGAWTARRDARKRLHRRQVLAGLHAVDSARGRHPSAHA